MNSEEKKQIAAFIESEIDKAVNKAFFNLKKELQEAPANDLSVFTEAIKETFNANKMLSNAHMLNQKKNNVEAIDKLRQELQTFYKIIADSEKHQEKRLHETAEKVKMEIRRELRQ